eukprot:5623-Pelagomonas_calceolata.AAC.6
MSLRVTGMHFEVIGSGQPQCLPLPPSMHISSHGPQTFTPGLSSRAAKTVAFVIPTVLPHAGDNVHLKRLLSDGLSYS